MLPCSPRDNSPDCAVANPVLSCERNMSVSVPRSIFGSDLADLRFRKPYTCGGFPSFRSVFTRHILHVFFMSTKKKMLWLYAQRLVALVTHLVTFGDWPTGENPRQAMRSILNSVYCRGSISMPIALTASADPEPTPFGLADLFPKVLRRFLTKKAIAGVVAKKPLRVNATTRPKLLCAVRAYACYGNGSHDLNLRHRLGCGQARSLRITAIGLLCIIALQAPVQAQRLHPLVDVNITQDDELTRLRRAVSAALDEVETLKRQLAAAGTAIKSLREAAAAAEAAIQAGAAEREAHERTLKIAEQAIAQQQGVIATYEKAIATLQTMVDMAMKRIDVLEKKVDKANGRTAILGTLLTVASIVAVFVRR
jgi:hypothetical protein